MDHAQAVLAGTEAPTVEDVIEWHEEQADRLAELGFTMGSYCDEDFRTHWEHVDDLQEAFSLENCAEEAMEQMHADFTRILQRTIIIRSNPALLARAEIEVHRRLLQAGKLEPKIELCVQSNASLRYKIVRLHKLEHRTEPREPDGVLAWVYLGANLCQKLPVNLPIKASLSKVCRLLEGIKKTEMPFLRDSPEDIKKREMPFLEDSPEGTRSVDAESVWKYHLVSRDKSALVDKKAVTLLTDEDYRKMIIQITRQRQDMKAPVAVITLVGKRSKNL